MDYSIALILAFLFSAFITVFRTTNSKLSQVEKSMIAMTIGWILVIYGLILSFSIGIFYNRYVTIREMFVNDVTNLQLTYRMLKDLNAPKDLLSTIRDYTKSVLEDQLPALQSGTFSAKTQEMNYIMNTKIINFLNLNREQVGLFTANMLGRLTTDVKIIQLVGEINSTEYYINILMFLIIFVLGPLYLNTAPDKGIQFILDFSLLSILFTGLYLCTILNNPFIDSPVSIKLTGYQVLLSEIDIDFPELCDFDVKMFDKSRIHN